MAKRKIKPTEKVHGPFDRYHGGKPSMNGRLYPMHFKVYAMLAKNGPMTVHDLAEALDLGHRGIFVLTRDLEIKGHVKVSGRIKVGPKVWRNLWVVV